MSKTNIIILVIVIAGLAGLGWWMLSSEPAEAPEGEVSAKEQACLDAGGSAVEAACCLSTEDFPNTCLKGSCDCAPEMSHQTKLCDCGLEKCFDGTTCRLVELQTVVEGCLSPTGASSMMLTEAQALAQGSSCEEEGLVGEGGFCNENTGTWWLDFDPTEPREGCNPACVVNIETRESEINWRCTGLIPE